MVDEKTISAIKTEYEACIELHRGLCATVSYLLETMLKAKSVQVHSISHRVKDSTSLINKISLPDKTYASLSDITDISGARIITYFHDDVDRVASIIRDEFTIDEALSIDKRKLLEPDRFGYQSLHFIAEIGADRCKLLEYCNYKTIKFEIQVRSILQHAWAEIEHDLGYKANVSVPREIRRRFAGVAGLLEIGDREFTALRDSLSQYENNISQEIRDNPDRVGLDLTSLRSLYSIDSHLSRLDGILSRVLNKQITTSPDRDFEFLLSCLASTGIKSIAELESAAEMHTDNMETFVKSWSHARELSEIHSGHGLFYLLYILNGIHLDKNILSEYMNASQIGEVEVREALIDEILAICNKFPR